MNKEKGRVPKLRFPGFTEDWEQRKLGDVTNIKTGSRNQQDSVANGKYPFFIRSEKIEKLDAYDFDTEAILVPGDGRIGEIFHYYNGKFALHQRVYKVDDFKGVDAFYLLYLFQCKFKEHALRLNAQGTVPSLRLPMFTEWNIYIPSLQEQICIGRLLNKIELMITLHQRKLEHLKLKKKALLQKLFPKNGERYPELRFPGFTDAWEQCKLSDILVERNEQQVETNEYPLMSFVQGYGVIPKGERYDRSFLVLDQSKKYKRTELGDFIYSSNNLETGSIGINKTGKAVISPVYSIFYGVSIGDSQFIGIMSLLPRFIAKMIRFRQGVVYGQWRIHEKDFLDISILIPSVDERTKITKLILSLEELVTLHQRKLGHLQLQKKALLQQMFV